MQERSQMWNSTYDVIPLHEGSSEGESIETDKQLPRAEDGDGGWLWRRFLSLQMN